MPTSKAEKDRRVVEGLCEQCGIEPLDGKSRKGPECRQKNREARTRRQNAKIAEGICITEGCHNRAKENCKMCQKCIDKSSKVTMQHYNKRKEINKDEKLVCLYHSRALNAVGKCDKCEAKKTKNKMEGKPTHYKKRKNKKLCYLCLKPGKPVIPGKDVCEEHVDYAKEKDKRLRGLYKHSVFEHYGYACVCCGLIGMEFMQIDHIYGGGVKHLKEIGKGNLYRWLFIQADKTGKFPVDYQPLCGNCNFAKGKSKDGKCPHAHWPIELLQQLRDINKKIGTILIAEGKVQLPEPEKYRVQKRKAS